jgi:hypothetical protein
LEAAMKIVTTYNGIHERFPIEKNIEMLATAGFDGIDFDDIAIESEVSSSSYRTTQNTLKTWPRALA